MVTYCGYLAAVASSWSYGIIPPFQTYNHEPPGPVDVITTRIVTNNSVVWVAPVPLSHRTILNSTACGQVSPAHHSIISFTNISDVYCSIVSIDLSIELYAETCCCFSK